MTFCQSMRAENLHLRSVVTANFGYHYLRRLGLSCTDRMHDQWGVFPASQLTTSWEFRQRAISMMRSQTSSSSSRESSQPTKETSSWWLQRQARVKTKVPLASFQATATHLYQFMKFLIATANLYVYFVYAIPGEEVNGLETGQTDHTYGHLNSSSSLGSSTGTTAYSLSNLRTIWGISNQLRFVLRTMIKNTFIPSSIIPSVMDNLNRLSSRSFWLVLLTSDNTHLQSQSCSKVNVLRAIARKTQRNASSLPNST